MKILKILLVLVVVLLVIAVIGVTMFLGSIIKTGVETVGPEVTGVPITLEKAEVSLLKGSAMLKELVVGNPEGFKTDYLFKLGRISVKVDVGSVKTDTVVIESIRIEGPEISYEKSLKTSNLGKLLSNLEGEPSEEEAQPEEKPAEAEEEGGKKVVINDLLIQKGKIKLSATFTGGHAMSIPLPEVHLTDIGKKSDGASVKEVITTVLKSIMSVVTQTVASSAELIGKGAKMAGDAAAKGADMATDAAQAAGGAAVKGAKALGEGAGAVGGKAADGAKAVGGAVTKGAGKAGDALKGGASKVTKGLGGLIPGKKKTEEEDKKE